jgi:ribA/ribD-fused uncharacterized protein
MSQKWMAPPWIRYPGIPMFSIGWRMGYGEAYIKEFSNYQHDLSEKLQKEYRLLFPAPITWQRYYSGDEDEPEEDSTLFFSASDDYFIIFWEKDGKPKYSRDTYRGSSRYVFFWRTSDPGNSKVLGQWQPAAFDYAAAHYSCTEQFMMAEKARLFGDKTNEAKILSSTDPAKMKALGRKVTNFEPDLWDKAKHTIVLTGNYQKFAQNKVLRQYLLSTGDAVLAEASPIDKIWGIGLSMDDPKAKDLRSWNGQNLLGFALMEVRDEIRRVYENVGLTDLDE